MLKLMNNPKFASIAQNTMLAVGTETCLKAVGRPTFTYLDPHADKDSKKFSATKELLYQSLCFLIYMSVIPGFKALGYKASRKIFNNNNEVKELLDYYKKEAAKNPNKNPIKKLFGDFSLFMNDYNKHKMNFDPISKGMKSIKGSVEAVSIVGSVLGLTLLAPEISNLIIHPIMNKLGLQPQHAAAPKAEDNNKKLEKQA